MFLNILKTTLRYFLKQKAYTIINIFGLAVGLATCVIIFLYIQSELSYDNFHENAENIYRVDTRFVFQGDEGHWAATQGSLIPALQSRYPEIIASVKIHNLFNPPVFRYEEKSFAEKDVFSVDTSFFDVFSFPIIYGDKNTLLNNENSIILTETTAKKYFGNENPIGKTIKTDDNNFSVTGVVEDVPENSHFHFNILISMNRMRKHWPAVDQPGPSAFYSYIKTKNKNTAKQLLLKINEDAYEIAGYITRGDSANIPEDLEIELNLTPITDIHLRSHLEKEIEANSDIQNIYIFGTIALLILIIAGINYMNLATARSAKRAREVGMRKVLGAHKANIFNQFISESFLITFLSLVFALVLVEIILPSFNSFADKDLSLNLFSNPTLLASLFCILIFIGFFSGSYPALFLSGFNPLSVLRSSQSAGRSNKTNLYLRRILVIVQFSISVLLIISSLFIFRQLNFIQNKEIGFNKEHVLVLPLVGRNSIPYLDVLKKELSKYPDLITCSPSSNIPGERFGVYFVNMPEIVKPGSGEANEDEGMITTRMITAGTDFVETMGMKIVAGRSFSDKITSDKDRAFLVNEAFVRENGIDNIVGKRMEYSYALQEPKVGKVIGVVEDFHYASLHNKVEPLMIQIFEPYYKYLSIRVNTNNITETIKNIEQTWIEVLPSIPFDYFFLDKFYDNMYKKEIRMSRIISYFTILAIVIACLGLFGLISYITEQRTKEIGIRKVLGASITSIITVLSKEFIILVIISNIIAWVPAYYFINSWLEEFAFRIDINPWIFAITTIISILIALATVGFISYITAKSNPVDALKYE